MRRGARGRQETIKSFARIVANLGDGSRVFPPQAITTLLARRAGPRVPDSNIPVTVALGARQ
jgi:hypothetical protein